MSQKYFITNENCHICFCDENMHLSYVHNPNIFRALLLNPQRGSVGYFLVTHKKAPLNDEVLVTGCLLFGCRLLLNSVSHIYAVNSTSTASKRGFWAAASTFLVIHPPRYITILYLKQL